MPNGRSPFAGGPLIRRGFERFANREERELAEELRRLRRRQVEQGLRSSEARFRREFDFRPEGAEVPVEGPISTPDDRPIAGGDRASRLSRALRESTPAGQTPIPERGAVSDATDSRGPNRTIADEMRDLRSTGGAELTPGDVREPEALSRVTGALTPEAVGTFPGARERRRATVPAEDEPGRIPLSGGGSISRVSPEERRREARVQRSTDTLAEAFDVPRDRAEAAVRLNAPGLVQDDPEQAREAQVNVAARMFLENPDADPRRIADQTGLSLDVIQDARSRAENLQPDLFKKEGGGGGEDLDFLDTEIGSAFRRFARQNPDGSIRQFERSVGQEIPQRFRSEAFDVLDEATSQRRAREEDFARAFGLAEGPTNRFQSQVLRRAAIRGDFKSVQDELQRTLEQNQRALNQLPTPAGPQRERAQQNVELAQRLLQALNNVQARAESTTTAQGFTFDPQTGTVRFQRQ